ncbi:MAG: VTT domain-containing protein [Thaumarchaeota archaeon]|nr:VTT domain-containing protein [Nitrososphaerota archaeon]
MTVRDSSKKNDGLVFPVLFLVLAAANISNSPLASIQSYLDPTTLIQWGGVAGVAAIIFVETGLFFGFFLPGDSLLITAGILASTGYLDLRWLLALSMGGAVIGDQVNYTIGLRLGASLVRRNERFRSYLETAERFYEDHGPKTITLARFVPVIRTFAPAVAGAARMKYPRFVAYNIAGGVLWVLTTTMLGYVLGRIIPQIGNYLLLVIAVVVVLSLIPAILEWRKMRSEARHKAPTTV